MCFPLKPEHRKQALAAAGMGHPRLCRQQQWCQTYSWTYLNCSPSRNTPSMIPCTNSITSFLWRAHSKNIHDTKLRYFSCTTPTAMAGKMSSLTKPSVEDSLPKPSQQGPDADCCPVERFYQRARIIHGSKKGRMMCQQATQRKSLMHQKLQTSCITLWPMLLRSCDGNHLTNIGMC